MDVTYPVNDPISKVYKMSESMTLLRLVEKFCQYFARQETTIHSNLSDLERLMYNNVNRLNVIMTSTADDRERPREKSH